MDVKLHAIFNIFNIYSFMLFFSMLRETMKPVTGARREVAGRRGGGVRHLGVSILKQFRLFNRGSLSFLAWNEVKYWNELSTA